MNIKVVELCTAVPILERICTDCARLVGPDGQPVEDTLAAVSEFVFVKQALFAEEIARTIGSVAPLTDGADVGSRSIAGKTTATREAGGIVRRVWIPEKTMMRVAYAYAQPAEEAEERRYVISHEIAHAWDFFVRGMVSPKELTAEETLAAPFRIHTVTEYHCQRLASEVAACIHSSRAVSADLLSKRYGATRAVVKESVQRIWSVLERLRTGTVDTRKASYIVHQELWSILTDCAQIFATISANPRLADKCEHPWADTPWENVLRLHLEAIRTLVASYPQWHAGAMRPVQDVWHSLGAEIFSCRFVENETEDRVVLQDSVSNETIAGQGAGGTAAEQSSQGSGESPSAHLQSTSKEGDNVADKTNPVKSGQDRAMNEVTHALSDRFEVKGYWWLPGDASRKIPGVLTYDDGRISLELFGFLQGQGNETPREGHTTVQRQPIILGSAEGQEYTLYQVQPIGPRIHAPVNNVEWTYSAHYLFVGAHFASEAALCFPAAAFSFSELENWLGQSAFDSERRVEEGKNVTTLTHRFPEAFEASVSALSAKAKIRSRCVLVTDGTGYSKNWTHRAFLQIEPAENQSLDWYLHFHDDCRDLLTLMVGEPVYTRHFNLLVPDLARDGNALPQVALLFRQDADRGRKEVLTPNMLVAYPAIQDRIAPVLEAWFARSEQLRTAHDLFFHTFYNTRPYLRSEFLSLVHALECYDRSVRPSRYLADEDYAKVKSALLNAIPAGTPSDLRDSLKSRIEYGNEYALRKRFKNLLKSLQPSAVQLVCDNPEDFAERISKTRHYFSHYTDELRKSAILETQDLFHAAHRLRILLTILLLKELGIEENTIVDAIRSNEKLNFLYRPESVAGDAAEQPGAIA